MKKFLCFVLCLILLISAFSVLSFAKKGKTEVTASDARRDIAIVFDDSGSMFEGDEPDRWSLALYATGVFASMLNYDSAKGDRLTIYPMYDPNKDNNSFMSINGKDLPGKTIEITEDNIEDIHNIRFKNTSPTILLPAYEAADALSKNKDPEFEKHLIVLTDGAFLFDQKYEEKEKWPESDRKKNLQEKLTGIAKSHPDIKVHYLGFGEASELKSESNLTAHTASTIDDLPNELVNICNSIFHRNEVSLSGNSFELEISASSLFVFTQRGDFKSLKNSDGELKSESGSKKIEPGNAEPPSNNNYKETAKVADIYGEVITFNDEENTLGPGTYTLDATGKTQIFFEPNIQIRTTLKNVETGEEFTEEMAESGAQIPPGKYQVNVALVDGNDPTKDVSDSPLLNNPEKPTIKVTNDGKTESVENGKEIELGAGDTEINVSWTIQFSGSKKYTLTNGDSAFAHMNMSLPDKREIKIEKISSEQQYAPPTYWYQISKYDEWKPIRVDIELDNQPLPDDQIQSLISAKEGAPNYVTCKIEHHESVNLRVELIPGESAFYVYLEKNEAGSIEEFEDKLIVEAKYTDEYKQESNDRKEVFVKVATHSAIFRYIVGGSIAAGAIFLLFFFLSRKVLPRKLIKSTMVFTISGKQINGNHKVKYNRRGKSLTVESIMPPDPESQCKISFSLYPVSRRWTPSRRRKVGIKGISGPSMGVKSVKLNGLSYTKDLKSGKFLAPGASPDDPIRDESNGEQIVINAKKSSLNCILDCR